jgi:hypothetical protein
LSKEKAFLLSVLCLALAGPARAEDWSAWERAYDPATRTRFIPVELWTGAPWDGAHEIRMAPAAELKFGKRGDQSIKGPSAWNGFQVYERMSRDKLQRFAIRDDQTGLGRVYDSRYASCIGEVKFPLGLWKQGEVREYRLSCPGRASKPLKVTIEEIDYVYQGMPHSLRFHWLLSEGRGRGTDMRYVYSPLRGLVHVQGNE